MHHTLSAIGACMVCGLAALPATAAEPCTLYKPRDLATARRNVEPHAWAKAILDGQRAAAAKVLALDRAAIEAMVPDLTPWSTYGQVCPACVGTKCAMGESGVLRWGGLAEPEKLTCKYCGTVFPDPRFPETGVLECPRTGQRFTYYINDQQRAHPEEDPGKHAYRWAGRPVHLSFTGVIRAHKVGWALSQMLPLAKLYALTGEAQYAERTAWILNRLAQVFPKYLYHSYGGCFADVDPAEAAREMGRHPTSGKFAPEVIRHPAAEMRDRNRDGFGDLDAGFWGAGRLTTGASGEGSALFDAVVAYDLTRDARRADGTPVYTPEMHRRLTDDLLLAGCADMENYAATNNKSGPGRALSGAVGMLFGQPERVRRALEGFEQLLADCFHFDGFCMESPAYSSMHLSLMQEIPEILAGYTDPPGYRPAKGERLQDFDPFDHLPRYRLALESMVRMSRPDLYYPVIGDTTAGARVSPHWVEILAAHYGARYAGLLETLQGAPLSQKGTEYALWHRDPDLRAPGGPADIGLRTEYFPGWQVGVLRAGGGESRTAFYFNGYRTHGHRHNDTLGILYHAFDKELASDRGYIWDDPRNAWTKSTLSHNIVVVDGESQNARDRRSRLELFGASPDVEVVQASADTYTQCSEYRRTCALVPLPDGGSYVVDLFRVAGGKLHQYAFHSNGRLAVLPLGRLVPIEGKLSWLTNLREAELPEGTLRDESFGVERPPARHVPTGFGATWEHEGVNIDLFMATALDRVLVTDAPGWRSYRGDQLNAPPITEILAERKADLDLESVFAAVMCPRPVGAMPVRGVERITPGPSAGRAIGVKVQLEGRTDYILSALDDEPRAYGPIRMAGRFGFVSLDEQGRLRCAYLLDGTELSYEGQSLKPERARLTRKVVKVDGSRVTLDAPLPAGASLVGRTLLTGETGFEIAAVEGNTLVVRDYPFVGGEEITIPSAAFLGAP